MIHLKTNPTLKPRQKISSGLEMRLTKLYCEHHGEFMGNVLWIDCLDKSIQKSRCPKCLAEEKAHEEARLHEKETVSESSKNCAVICFFRYSLPI